MVIVAHENYLTIPTLTEFEAEKERRAKLTKEGSL